MPVASLCVIRLITLEEHDAMAASIERFAQPAPQGRMTVAPGRADAQAEDDDPHAATCIFNVCTCGPVGSKTAVVTDPGPIGTCAKALGERPSHDMTSVRMISACVIRTRVACG